MSRWAQGTQLSPPFPRRDPSGERGHRTAGGDGLMVRSGLECGLGSWNKDGATGRGVQNEGETGRPGSDCRAEKRHQLGTRQPKARDLGSVRCRAESRRQQGQIEG